MADKEPTKESKEEKKEGDSATTPPKKGSNMVLLIAGGVILLLLAIGVPVVMFVMKKEEKVATEELARATALNETPLVVEGSTDEDEHLEGEEPLGAIFPLESFVVNLSGGKFLRCQMQIEFAERDIPKRFYPRVVLIRDAIITLLTSKTLEDLSSATGKTNLKTEAKDLVNELLGKELVKTVYFTQFVMQ